MRAIAATPGLVAVLAAGLVVLAGCATEDAQNQQVMAELDRTAAALRAAGAGVDPWNAPPRPAGQAGRAAPGLGAGAVTGTGTGPELLPVFTAATFRAGPIRDANGLVGATAPTLVRALGQPDLRRRDGDSEAWLYRGETCMLDVVLYPDPTIGREGRVAFAAARAVGLERVPEHTCLSEILRAHQLVARARE